MGKEGNVGIKIKYISLLKKCYLIKKLFFHFNLIKRNLKTCNFFLMWKIDLGNKKKKNVKAISLANVFCN